MSAPRSRRLWVAVQLAITAVAFAVLAATTDVPRLRATLAGAPLWGIPAASVLLLAVMWLGGLRWRLALLAYGAQQPPGVTRLFSLHVVGLFYNTVAGGVGGDALRGVVSREAFGDGGLAKGLAVVLVERVLGLASILILVSAMLVWRPIPSLHIAPSIAIALLSAVVAALVALGAARRVAPHLPSVLAKHADSLPELQHWPAFGGALACSIVNQMAVAMVGYVLLSPLAPSVSVADTLTLCPIAFAAVFVPLTVAGGGTRDAAMVALFAPLGVSDDRALAASAQIWVTYLLVSAIGGLLSMVTDLHPPEASSASQDG